MKLQEIDKATYRFRLNRIIIAFVVGFALLAIIFGSVLIALFGDVQVGDEPVNNFRFNLVGVILGLIVSGAVLNKLKNSAFFNEVFYVWQLKQIHNLIYRKQKKIEAAAKEGDINAFIVLNYYYQTLLQVYKLDDNTLTLSNVHAKQAELDEQMATRNVSISTEQFNKEMISAF